MKEQSAFERLKSGLKEAIQFCRGEISLRTTEFPDSPPHWRSGEIVRLRQRLNMSQAVFAQVLNVSLKTLQCWERGDRKPSQTALRLLQILEHRPQVVNEVLGLHVAIADDAKNDKPKSKKKRKTTSQSKR